MTLRELKELLAERPEAEDGCLVVFRTATRKCWACGSPNQNEEEDLVVSREGPVLVLAPVRSPQG